MVLGKNKSKKNKESNFTQVESEKKPGKIKQIGQVIRMTKDYDSRIIWFLIIAFLLPTLIGLYSAIFLSSRNWVNIILFSLTGIFLGLLLALTVLNIRASRAAYAQVEVKPGAVGAVLKSGLIRKWLGNETPCAINQKTQDAVFRAVGKGGIALIAEGSGAKLNKLVNEEAKKINRIAPNVALIKIYIGTESGKTPLHKLKKRLKRVKKTLRKSEFIAVSNRINSLQSKMPIPQGIDPLKARVQRKFMR